MTENVKYIPGQVEFNWLLLFYRVLILWFSFGQSVLDMMDWSGDQDDDDEMFDLVDGQSGKVMIPNKGRMTSQTNIVYKYYKGCTF